MLQSVFSGGCCSIYKITAGRTQDRPGDRMVNILCSSSCTIKETVGQETIQIAASFVGVFSRSGSVSGCFCPFIIQNETH